MILQFLFFVFIVIRAEPIGRNGSQPFNNTITRRILSGKPVGETRPYMVYLRPAISSESHTANSNWLCGGVIIHERYILTSAACIEDAKQFYVISGTHRWVPPTETHDDCVNYGAKRAVWKCVPKSYVFDGAEFENIRWMVQDIAVVKVDEDFNFKRRVKGCDFIPKKVAFNNVSHDLEKPGTIASIAGWGSTFSFSDVIAESSMNFPELLETDVLLTSKKNCKSRWDERYHHIIDQNMICTKDATDSGSMDVLCGDNLNCKELEYSENEEEQETQPERRVLDPQKLIVHKASHGNNSRKANTMQIGGFCENDHGGPLIVGQGKSSIVVGVISACLTRDITHKCYGPFLYTSVWNHRHLINCAINKDIGAYCRRLLRSTNTQMVETTFAWSPHSTDVRFSKDSEVPPNSSRLGANNTNVKNITKT